ncbi:MAG: 3'(2'),5'-bisphosphate nucleotidase CysQ [Nitrospirales bacterium]|nr:3'(2'),5'-bisphosphate nucleotidase CysQ [Nitrospira sp.]MDR4500160.1 3'(2'),5'-bisphosphate nucleotidase CysQ [Nitrospirales bacterium]
MTHSQYHILHSRGEVTFLDSVVREAGQRVLELIREGFEVMIKPDSSQVTTADLAVDQLLKDHVHKAYPQDGWLSEESPDDRQRLKKTRVWILDPIDGTRNFISQIPQYAISMALVEDEEPVIGMIFNPATDEMFLAMKDDGAFFNEQPISGKSTSSERVTCLANLSNNQRRRLQELAPTIEVQPFGSIACALALQAAGRADIMLNPGNQNEWDIAAGVLMIQEAGGIVHDRHGQPIRFNQPTPTTQGVIATRPDLTETVERLLDILDAT